MKIRSNYTNPPDAKELRGIISQRLKELRVRRKMMQKDVADLADINIFTYSGYENGRALPPVDCLLRIAEILDVSLDFLTGRIDTVRTFIGEEIDTEDSSLETRLARIEKALRENDISY